MHFVASRTNGSGNACVGQASRQAVQVPQWRSANGGSGASSRSVRSAARKKKLPRRGLMSIVFLPIQPEPGAAGEVALQERGGVGDGPAAQPGTSASSHAASVVEPVPDEAVVVRPGGVGRYASQGSGDRGQESGRHELAASACLTPIPLPPLPRTPSPASPRCGPTPASRRGGGARRPARGGSPSRRRSRGRASRGSARTRRLRWPARCRTREKPSRAGFASSDRCSRVDVIGSRPQCVTPTRQQSAITAIRIDQRLNRSPHLRPEVLLLGADEVGVRRRRRSGRG